MILPDVIIPETLILDESIEIEVNIPEIFKLLKLFGSISRAVSKVNLVVSSIEEIFCNSKVLLITCVEPILNDPVV